MTLPLWDARPFTHESIKPQNRKNESKKSTKRTPSTAGRKEHE